MPQAIWTGTLRLSLVSIPVRLFPATASAKRLTLHQIHEPTGKRIRYQKVAPGVGPVESEEIVKGYEYTRGKYVLISDEEIEDLKLESKQTIELTRFVEHDDIDARYYEKPYYMLPDGEAAMEGYVTVREALAKTKRAGIGHFVLRGRSVIAALRPCGRGLLLEALRHQHELRQDDDYFREIEEVKVDSEALSLAVELIERKEGPFEPEKLKDDYYEAMQELVEAKLEEREPEIAAEPPRTAKVINFKDALRKSVKERRAEKKSGAKQSKSSGRRGAKKGSKKAAKPKSRAKMRKSA